MNSTGYTGIKYPFSFLGTGSVAVSSTSEFDLAHIEEEIIQVLCTRKGERANMPNYGSRLHEVAFDNEDETTLGLVKTYCREALGVLSDLLSVESVDASYVENDSMEQTVIIELTIFVFKYLKTGIVTVPYKMGGE